MYGGIKDAEFIRGNVPMTKKEIRDITINKLEIYKQCELLDIGAGTGSISIEAFNQGANVTCIEINEEAISLIEQNSKKFNANINIIKGYAPSNIPKKYYNRVFIGGSKGKLSEIYNFLDEHLKDNGILVANTVTLENTYKNFELMKKHKYKEIEVIQVNISRNKRVSDINMMISENPITIIKGYK